MDIWDTIQQIFEDPNSDYNKMAVHQSILACTLLPIFACILLLATSTRCQPTPSDNCLIYNADNSVCSACRDGFYLAYYFCAPCSPLCSCSSSRSYCDNCRDFSIHDQLPIELSSYRDADRCRFCNVSIPNCLTCSSSSNCSACFNGRYLDPTTQLCSNDTCTPNCELCASPSACRICQLGFAAVGGSCQEQTCVDNCTLCNSDGSACLTCIDSYYEVNGICSACMEYCLRCTDESSCDDCAPEFYLINGTCENGTVANCVEYGGTQSSPACLACQPNFYMSGGSCNQCSGCFLCSQAFICLSPCMPGFFPFNYQCLAWEAATSLTGVLLLFIFVYHL